MEDSSPSAINMIKNEFSYQDCPTSMSTIEVSSNASPNGHISEIVEGSKKDSKIFVDEFDFVYHQNKKRKTGGYILRCHVENCSGSGIYIPQTLEFRRLKNHCHLPCRKMIDKWKFLAKVKERAETEITKLKTIYEEEAIVFENSDLPSYEKIKSSLMKRRNKSIVKQSSSQAAFEPEENNLHAEIQIGLTNSGFPIVQKNALAERSDMASKQPISLFIKSEMGNQLYKADCYHFEAPKQMEVIEGPKRFSKAYIDDLGYSYQVNRKRESGGYFLRCHRHGCRGSAIYNTFDKTYEKLASHSHYPDPHMVQRWRFLHVIKSRAEKESTPLKEIYEQETKRFDIIDLPPFKKIESTLQKRRRNVFLRENQTEAECDSNTAVTKSSHNKSDNSFQFASQEEEELTIDNPTETIDVSCSAAGGDGAFCESLKRNFVESDHEHNDYNDFNAIKQDFFKTEITQLNYGEFIQSNAVRIKSGKVHTKKRRKTKKRRYIKSTLPKILSNFSSKMEVIEGSKRYSKKYIDEASFVYLTSKVRYDGVHILKCQSSRCNSTGLFSPEDSTFRRIKEHNHQPEASKVQNMKFLTSIKNRAETETTALRKIYKEELQRFPDVKGLPFDRLASTLHKRRRAKHPCEPKSICEAEEQLKTFFSSQIPKGFYRQHLTVPENNCEILIFISPRELEKEFSQASSVHFDTCFKTVPHFFEEILIVSLVVSDHAFPVIYALLTKSSDSAYLCLLNYLRNEFPLFAPSTITTDFKYMLEKALQVAFPEAIITGCWFYYTQSVWRHSQQCSLGEIFFKDESVKLMLKSIMGLPLLPALTITPALTCLTRKLLQDEYTSLPDSTRKDILSLLNFVKEEWICKVGIHRFSIFKIPKGLSFDIEELYHLFFKKFGIDSPSFNKFIEKLFQFDSVIISKFHEAQIRGRTKTRSCLERQKKIQELEEKIQVSSLSLTQSLTIITDLVPTFVHHDLPELVQQKDAKPETSCISEAFSFCEINISEPEENYRKADVPHLSNHLQSSTAPLDSFSFDGSSAENSLVPGPAYFWNADNTIKPVDPKHGEIELYFEPLQSREEISDPNFEYLPIISNVIDSIRL